MDILDILIYLIFFLIFVLNLVTMILKLKEKRARGEPLINLKRRYIKIPRELYYYVRNFEVTSGKSEAERLTGGIKLPHDNQNKNMGEGLDTPEDKNRKKEN